jgi:outer membrane lipoprotein-sorting protein
MIEKRPESIPDIVDRAVGELRSSSSPPEMPPELLEALLQAAKASDNGTVHFDAVTIYPTFLTRTINHWRYIMRSPISHIAAAAVFVFAVAGVFFWLHSGGATVTFAQVAEQFLKVKSYKLKGNHLIDDQFLDSYDMIWAAPGRSRQDFKNKEGVIDRVIIRDGNSERLKETNLAPGWKNADLMEYVNLPDREPFFDEAHGLMLKARDKKMEATSLGEEVIEGHRSIGYRLNIEKYSATQDIWADAETLLPVRIEISNVISRDKQTSKNVVMKAIWSNIEYNVKLDDSLFSLAPPEGYKVRKHKKLVLPKQEKQSDEPAPLNYGPDAPLGEVEEEGTPDAKNGQGELKELSPQKSGSLVPSTP